jgi:AraC-like DNA-binding protein
MRFFDESDFHPIFIENQNLTPWLYMDLHVVPGVNAKDVADAHSMDVLMEKEHHCKCLTYWIDELRGYVFCLIDAPDKESLIELHTRAHGLVPNKIIEVEPGLVHAFLGRITDPENTAVTDTGLKILDDTSYRIIMHIRLDDFTLLEHKTNSDKATELYQSFKANARKEILKNNGREVSSEANEMVASFVEGDKAFSDAIAIQELLKSGSEINVRISMHAGEPVMHSDKLFGDTIQMLKRLNMFSRNEAIIITPGIKELLNIDAIKKHKSVLKVCSPKDEIFITSLFDILDSKYADEKFDIEECCRLIAMSQSQLYRKTTDLFQLSPNNVLRNYRLIKSKELLRTTDKTISQISFDTGFASTSYFIKCFKSQYGLLPLAYQDLSHNK